MFGYSHDEDPSQVLTQRIAGHSHSAELGDVKSQAIVGGVAFEYTEDMLTSMRGLRCDGVGRPGA